MIVGSMEPSDSIRRLGFARWYERRLIEGHAWFITGVLAMVAIGAAVEALGQRASVVQGLFDVAVATAAFGLGIYGFKRYQVILSEAETLGENATCRACGTYARFRLVSPTQARCRNCGGEWSLFGGP